MAIIGTASASEAFSVNTVVNKVLADQHVGLSINEQEFRQRASEVITAAQPGSSNSFIDYVIMVAWAENVTRRIRLELSPLALHVLRQQVEALPADAPGAADLRAAVTAAVTRVGWEKRS